MASDRYSGTARCPHCEDVHWLEHETLFFNRHEWPSNLFVKGVAVPIALAHGDLDGPRRHGEWVRIREPVAGRCHVLDPEGARTCDCGARIAPVLVFAIAHDVPTPSGPIELRTSRATLLDIELHAIGPALWERVDFAPVPRLYGYPDDPAAPLADRIAISHAIVDSYLTVFDDTARYRHVAGPTRCAACDQVRERRFAVPVDLAFRLDRWPGSTLFLGARMEIDRRFLDEDCDDTNHLRVHHPVAASTITVLGEPRRSGCACRAGRGALVLRFERHPHELELVDLELRVVHGARDIDDIDFVATTAGIRTQHRSRLEALASALHAFERH